MQRQYSNRALTILIAAWLVICIAVVWFFEYRHWASWQDRLALFSPAHLHDLKPLVPQGKQITVMHFRTADCRCTSYQDTHISELVSILKGTVQVVVNQTQLISLGLPIATPSVAIWDEDGEIAYFGPYSSGAVCGQGTGFVEKTLATLENGTNPEWLNTQGVGCFCQALAHKTI